MDKLYIREDISDWRDEAFRDELIVKNDDDIYRALDDGIHTAKIARSVIVSRELKYAPEDIIRGNKILVNVAAQKDVISKAHSQKIEYQTESGKTFKASAYVGNPAARERQEDDDGNSLDVEDHITGPSFVHSDSVQGLERAEKYLLNVVPGYVMGRLKIIALNGGDVESAAEQLKNKIDSMVEILS